MSGAKSLTPSSPEQHHGASHSVARVRFRELRRFLALQAKNVAVPLCWTGRTRVPVLRRMNRGRGDTARLISSRNLKSKAGRRSLALRAVTQPAKAICLADFSLRLLDRTRLRPTR